MITKQRIPAENEIDEKDSTCKHYVGYVNVGGKRLPIATARSYVTDDNVGKVGRVAVLKEYRGRGFGGSIMNQILAEAKEDKLQKIVLHSQSAKRGFYEKLGYVVEGEEFLEEDIPHLKMVLQIG
ncbi:hypothetical protein HK098_007895 [Nowakowskiella sp. JEL0407]|nr:hypothetical protein HK098_007895 [Nowakowskiella sp. JEL0407]